MFFNKKVTFGPWIDPVLNLSLSEIVVPCLSEPPTWHKQMAPYNTPVGEFSKPNDLISSFPQLAEKNSLQLTAANMKTCYGMTELFKRSFLMKFPCDIMIYTASDGRIIFKSMEFLFAEHHNGSISIISNDMVHCKIVVPNIMFTSDKKIDMFYGDNYYYKNQPFKVMPGIVSFTDKFGVNLIVNMSFPKADGRFFFKKGDPWFVMTNINDIKLTLKQQMTKPNPFTRKKILSSFFHDINK